MPEVNITLNTSPTSSGGAARRSVTGFSPPLASVAVITARSVLVTSTEHWRK